MEFDEKIEGNWVGLSTQVVDTIKKCSVACDCFCHVGLRQILLLKMNLYY